MRLRVVLVAALALVAGYVAAPARAQESPPFAVGGFSYRKTNNIHFFDCAQPACGRDSRVSYIIGGSAPGYTLARFRAEQELIARQRRAQMPGGAVTLRPTTEKRDKLFRILSTGRVERAPDGSQRHFRSTMLIGESGAVHLISSGPDRRMAERNLNLFMLPAMMIVGRTN